jgi:hypothetical protein
MTGADLSRVRVHAAAAAATLSDSVDAHAFTSGRHIYFGHGEYRPASPAGRQMIAHELAHVVQQGQSAPITAGTAGAGSPPAIQRVPLRVTTRSGQRRGPYRTRLQQRPGRLGQRIGLGHTRIMGMESAINTAALENLPSLPASSIMPRGNVDVSDSGGWVTYRGIANSQRSGVSARITRSMIRKGTSTGGYNFPFFRRRFGLDIIRGHLLARVLGGSGTQPRNLVPLYHRRSNLPMYADIESRIQRSVEQGNVVNFDATPTYDASRSAALRVLPVSVSVTATNAATGANVLPQRTVTFSTGL